MQNRNFPNEIKDLKSKPQGPGPVIEPDLLSDINWLRGPEPRGPGLESKLSNEIKDLPGPGPTGGRSENGAPVAPVTEAPNNRARAGLLAQGDTHPTPGKRKRVPRKQRKVPIKKRGKSLRIPSAKDLFG